MSPLTHSSSPVPAAVVDDDGCCCAHRVRTEQTEQVARWTRRRELGSLLCSGPFEGKPLLPAMPVPLPANKDTSCSNNKHTKGKQDERKSKINGVAKIPVIFKVTFFRLE